MHFRGAVVDTEGAHVGKDPCDYGFAGHALAAEDLHAAIGDAPGGLRGQHLGHARLAQGQAALVEYPGGVKDGQARAVHVHLVRSEEHTSELQSQSNLVFRLFFFNDTATTEIYPLSLHDALPISLRARLPWSSTQAV